MFNYSEANLESLNDDLDKTLEKIKLDNLIPKKTNGILIKNK